jgi:hypothetical protein
MILSCSYHFISPISHFNVSYEEEYLILTSKKHNYTNPSIEYKDVKFSTR